MSDREKRLALIVGMLGGLFVLFFGYIAFNDGLITRQNEITSLQDKVRGAQKQRAKAIQAKKQLNGYLAQSLPQDPVAAKLRYDQWLRKLAANSFDIKPIDSAVGLAGKKNQYEELSFQLTGRGTLEDVAEFMREFYGADELHRIQKLNLTGSPGDKQIRVAMTVAALALNGATRTDFGQRPSPSFADELESHRAAIVARNLFAPANKGPVLARLSNQRVERGERLSVDIKANDPDNNQLEYELVDNEVEGVKIDKKTGKISWHPEENGDYEFTVKVTDDGLPAKSATRTLRVTVSDPRPRPEPAREEGIDKSQFAFVCGITGDVGENAEVMLNLRTENKTTRYGVGDAIKIGPVDGIVSRIEGKTVEIKTDKGSFVVELGQSLADGRKKANL